MYRIVDKLRLDRVRDSTKQNYYSVWKAFNSFFLRLDVKPILWEDRLVLYAAFLVQNNRKAQTVRSYICAIKNILRDDGVEINEDKFLLTSLTKACWLKNTKVVTHLPIQRNLLQLLLLTLFEHYYQQGQIYLAYMYVTLFSTMYFGMFRIGELTLSPHVARVTDVQLGENKNKVLFIRRSLKTHDKGSKPQLIKIKSRLAKIQDMERTAVNTPDPQTLCPFKILRSYMAIRPKFINNKEQFFVFRDRSPLTPTLAQKTLKLGLQLCGVDNTLYNMHSFRTGRTIDLHKLGVELSVLKIFGRWKLNAIFAYLK